MLWSAFILGLLGSFHCIGMCGPIAFLLPVDRSNSLKKFTQVFSYNFGRLFTYALIGLIFGMIGKSLYIFGLHQHLSIIIGVIMIVAVLIPSHLTNKLKPVQPIYRMISKVKSALGNALKKKTTDTFLTIGFLNGFLPCGLVYMAVFGSLATGQAVMRSLYMILFGLGDIPLMTAAVYLGKFLNTKMKQNIQKAIPVFVILIGVLFILRGLGLGIPYISPAPMADMVFGTMNCH